MQQRLRYTIIPFITTLFIFLFVYTATSKLIDIAAFQSVMRQSPFIGKSATFLAWFIPIIEIAIASTLCIPQLRSKGLLAATLLMTIFTTYIAAMLLTASRLPCSCGGVLKQLNWPGHLILNVLLTMLAYLGYRWERKNKDFIAINRSSRIPV